MGLNRVYRRTEPYKRGLRPGRRRGHKSDLSVFSIRGLDLQLIIYGARIKPQNLNSKLSYQQHSHMSKYRSNQGRIQGQ